jgi:hypothetical protein
MDHGMWGAMTGGVCPFLLINESKKTGARSAAKTYTVEYTYQPNAMCGQSHLNSHVKNITSFTFYFLKMKAQQT